MTMEIEELTEDELIQLKHYWCIQTDRRDSKCILDGKVIWEGNSCKGCPYEIKNRTIEIGDTVNVMKYDVGYWEGKITKIHFEHTPGPNYSQPIAAINEINGRGHCVAIESNLEFKDGEWWEVRL